MLRRYSRSLSLVALVALCAMLAGAVSVAAGGPNGGGGAASPKLAAGPVAVDSGWQTFDLQQRDRYRRAVHLLVGAVHHGDGDRRLLQGGPVPGLRQRHGDRRHLERGGAAQLLVLHNGSGHGAGGPDLQPRGVQPGAGHAQPDDQVRRRAVRRRGGFFRVDSTSDVHVNHGR